MAPALANLGRARQYMDASGVDALITWSPANVRYLTGYWCWLAPLFRHCMLTPGGDGLPAMRNVAVAPREGEVILIVESLWGPNTVDTWAGDVRLAGPADLRAPDEPPRADGALDAIMRRLAEPARAADVFDALAAALEERGLARSRLGIEMDGASPAELDGLRARLPGAQLRDASNLLRLVRAVKTAAEIERLTRAAQIAERAAAQVLGGARDGDSAGALAQRFRRALAGEGADLDHFAIAPRGLGFTAGGSPAVRAGDVLYVDFGAINEGWFSDSGTTLCLGPPSSRALEEFAAVRDCVAAGAAALRPGALSSQPAIAMREALAQRGITESFPHGHGLGIEVRDYPLIMPAADGRIADGCIDVAADLPLEEGMVVNLEAPLLTPGVRSVHCERTFVVTAQGSRPLLPQDREAPVLAGASG